MESVDFSTKNLRGHGPGSKGSLPSEKEKRYTLIYLVCCGGTVEGEELFSIP